MGRGEITQKPRGGREGYDDCSEVDGGVLPEYIVLEISMDSNKPGERYIDYTHKLHTPSLLLLSLVRWLLPGLLLFVLISLGGFRPFASHPAFPFLLLLEHPDCVQEAGLGCHTTNTRDNATDN